ncbi:hypothetical protein [uncultured Marinobacter sp.]|uniref:hypothetical protein n=1 Tax=uncultured Marinobacter sp. TaxID=187379 RepID=UPI00261CF92F|nr:hypothetical protein [uncultured Marinobacter sp.]
MNKLTLSALVLMMTLGLAACSQEDEGADFEKAADNAGDMMEDAGESMDEAIDDTGDAMEEAGDSMEESYEEATDDSK